MKLPSVPVLIEAFLGVVQRFPFVMLSAFTGVVAAITLIEGVGGSAGDLCAKLLLTSALGLPGFLAVAAWSERRRYEGIRKWLPSAMVLALLLVYYVTLQVSKNNIGVVDMIRFTGLNLFAHLLVAYLPYLDDSPVEDFWEYNKRLFANIVIGAVYSLIIFAGLSVAILAVDNLFNLKIKEQIYPELFAVVAGIFNTAYFLSQFPDLEAKQSPQSTVYTRATINLSKYILIPIVGIYFLILYAYTIKILVTWNLPQGWVSVLVLGFSVAGVFTYLLNYMLVKFDSNVLVHHYRRWFFFVLLPMVGLLFVAIGRRISDYGVTEDRFVVATAGVWLFITSLYFIISKKDNIKFIPVSLSVFALLTVLGPFSAFRASHKSQTGRLHTLLEKNVMLENGKAVAARDTISAADAESIRSILYYLREYEHFEDVAPWFGLPAGMKSPDWGEIDRILGDLKVGYGSPEGPTCDFYFARQEGLSLAGYERLWTVNVYDGMDLPENFSGWWLAKNNEEIEFYENGTKIAGFDVQPFLQDILVKYNCNPVQPDSKDAWREWKTPGMQAKLFIEQLSIEKGEILKIRSMTGLGLTRAEGKNN